MLRIYHNLRGVLELGESIEAGLCCEVKEETGLTVQPVSLTGVYKNMNRGIIALVFPVPHPRRPAHHERRGIQFSAGYCPGSYQHGQQGFRRLRA